MFEKKNFVLNCDVCDTRKMKEEDYSGYEKMMINADIVIVNETSKSILNRLPATINQDEMIELSDSVEYVLKTVNGSCEITGTTAVQEHTILSVNGSLQIHPGTEEVLKRYELITVNGSVRCPKSLEGYLNKMSVNGSVSTYPDDCVILDGNFLMDQYFPLRAKEGSKYYAEHIVVIRDKNVDIAKLVQKNVKFETPRLVLPECRIEECVPVFHERTEFVVVPDGMELIYGNITLNEELVRKSGSRLFVYGNMRLDENSDAAILCGMVEKLIVKGVVTLKKEQQEAFRNMDAKYDGLEIAKNGRILQNMPSVKIDKNLFDNSPDGIHVCNAAMVKIAADVTPEMILEKLSIANCAKVICDETQESTVAAIAENVASIGSSKEDGAVGGVLGDVFGAISDLAHTKLINADSYVM